MTGRSILLKFAQIVGKRYKQEVAKFGSHSLSGFRVETNILVVCDKNSSLPPVGNSVNFVFSCYQGLISSELSIINV